MHKVKMIVKKSGRLSYPVRFFLDDFELEGVTSVVQDISVDCIPTITFTIHIEDILEKEEAKE